VRWDQYSVSGVNATATQSAGVWTTTGYTSVPERTWEFTNYQVGLVFKPTASSSVYASWSTSSTPPTISAGDQNASGGTGSGDLANTVLDPEDSESFEIGAKANVFNDRLALSAALFQTTRKNAAILVSGTTDYEQAGEVEVKGLELGVSGSITPAWTVFGGYTYMDSELVEGAYTSVNIGDPLANTPEHTASLFSTYRVTRKLTLGGGVYYTSESFGGNQGGAGGGTNRIYAPEWTRVDAFASYDLTDRASLQLNVKNLTDEEYIIRTNGVHHADVAPARQAILALNLRF
jgi:catecholate siderophore receptor